MKSWDRLELFTFQLKPTVWEEQPSLVTAALSHKLEFRSWQQIVEKKIKVLTDGKSKYNELSLSSVRDKVIIFKTVVLSILNKMFFNNMRMLFSSFPSPSSQILIPTHFDKHFCIKWRGTVKCFLIFKNYICTSSKITFVSYSSHPVYSNLPYNSTLKCVNMILILEKGHGWKDNLEDLTPSV